MDTLVSEVDIVADALVQGWFLDPDLDMHADVFVESAGFARVDV